MNPTPRQFLSPDPVNAAGGRSPRPTPQRPMLAVLAATAVVAVASLPSFAAPFTPGNLAILRAGSGAQTLANTGNTLFVDEVTPAGVLVQSIAVPDTGASALIVSGTATSEGALSRSPNGRWLCFAGYNTPRPAGASLTSSTSAAVPRGVGVVDPDGNFTLAAVTTTQFSANNIRSAATDGTNSFWAAGGNSGTYYLGLANTPGAVQTGLANTRVLGIFNGNLYFSTASGSARGVYGFSDASLPTGTATTNLLLNGGATSSIYGFAFSPDGLVAYTADDSGPTAGGGIRRWTNSGTAWSVAYTVTTNAVRGLTVDWSAATPVLYATTATNSLIAVTDTGAGSPVTLLVRGAANTALRGVAFTPVPPPSPLQVVIAVTNRIYHAYRTDLAAGTWVYVDADPAAGSPVRASQRSLGYREVDYKSQVPGTLGFTPATPTTNGNVVTYDYSTQTSKSTTVGFWVEKNVPIIIGPDGNAYITDGHHTTAGYLSPNSPVRQLVPGKNRVILGHIVANYFDPQNPQAPDDAWWLARAAENNALLFGVSGDQLILPDEPGYAGLQPILPSIEAMPMTPSNLTTNGVRAMTNSNYRALAWGLADAVVISATTGAGAKIAGYKKTAPGSSVDINFVEFFWADFLRDRVVWDNTLSGSPLGSTNGDANATAAPLSFFAASANGIALARSEVYRDRHGRLLRDYTNSAQFTPNTVNWARGSLSNGLAAATDTYHLYLRDDSSVMGDITPSARSTNHLHIDTTGTLLVTNTLLNFRTITVNGGGTLRTAWKDATVSNSTLRLPAGNGLVVFNGTLLGGTVTVAGGTLAGNGTLDAGLVVAAGGTLAPGDTVGILGVNGPLTLAGATVMEITKSGGTVTADRITGVTTLTAGGSLQINASGEALAAGDQVQHFAAAVFTGVFNQIMLPALAPGLAWDASHLHLDGTLSVVPGAAITTQPRSLTITNGDTARFVIAAEGNAPLAYQWYFNGITPLANATSDTLEIANAQAVNAGDYTVVVSNPDGVVTSAVARLTVRVRAAIVQSPASLTVCQGYPATFTVMAAGDAPIQYQWRWAGSNLAGATAATLVIPNASASRAGAYDVVVSNPYGAVTSSVATLTVTATFAGFVNKGLVGVGRLPADSFDQLGAGIDTLGAFSSMALDPATWSRTGDAETGYTYSGLLYAAPDRGFGDGAQDYHARLETFTVSITPYYGDTATNQSQIVLSNSATLLLTDLGMPLTGFDPNDTSVPAYPQSRPDSLGQGRRSLDSEGLVRTADGGWFVCDEYGPMIVRFNAAGELQYTLLPPAGLLPKNGGYPGTNVWTATNNPASGRRSNRGFEGLAMLPDGKRLAAVLQSPAIQDAGAANGSRNTRLLIFDIDNSSATFGRAIAEYVYPLTLNGSALTNRHTPLSELVALSSEVFLVLERDGIGLGALPAATPIYKRVNVLSTRGATNIINTGYDLELGAPFQASLPTATLPANIAPVQRFDLVDLLDPAQLAKFGLNTSTNQDANTICEKWEGLALLPLNDPANPDDFLLLVGNDNDFKAPLVYHNGQIVGTNTTPVDVMVLAYRVTLPLNCELIPANQAPGIAITSPANPTLSAPAAIVLTATAHDPDGLVTNVVFFEGATMLGSAGTFPFQLALPPRGAGTYNFTAVAWDQLGASTTSIVKSVVVTVSNLAPVITLVSPTNGQVAGIPGTVTLLASASDPDGSVTNVVFFEGDLLLGQRRTAPFSLTLTNPAPGAHSYRAVAWDNQGLATTSGVVTISVVIRPAITGQPVGRTNNVGTEATFMVTATGDEPLRYQWRLGTAILPGATNPILTLTSVQLTNAGGYSVVVANAGGAVTSAVATLTVNRPPTVPNRGAATSMNQALDLSLASLLTGAVDADGDPLVVTSVTTPSTNGAPVILGPTAVTYTPATGFTGTDRFSYTVSDGRGGLTSAEVEILVVTGPLPSPGHAAISRTGTGVVIRFSGVPGKTYEVQRATSITGPWSTLSTQVAPLPGIIDYLDENPPQPVAFYRTVNP